ncbi:Acyl transferase domain-containing protein [Actinokineospora iranica]|uniref:Acyl transferase domain-containing protein n=2 Tax=Actinokineospora iranica TaxID=1271860 RepID=A0A1G6YSR1_9PSEU|nr:Acyl transferase domain-containing protein [Actinokineospora iranica]
MAARGERPELVLGVGPAGQPCAGLCGAVSAAGGLGVLDLGAGDHRARAALTRAAGWPSGRPFGLRVPAGCALGFDDVAAILGPTADQVEVVLLGWGAPWSVSEVPDRYFVLVEVTSVAEALTAAAMGADGVVARGNEAGGRVGESGAFVLLQQLLAEPELALPVWVCGGIGPDTAAAAIVGGAAGVVLDTQLALLPEADVPDDLTAALATSDGTDTVVIDGQRLLPRRAPATGHLPVGQDAYLATAFLNRFGTVARAVAGVLAAVHEAVRADRTPVLGSGSPLARALGTALPVAQGPMTRVSDRAGFAAAVAGEGGLPFLALALASGEQTRTMMTETAAALGARPWGVGVLGFAPPEIRSAQLAVIEELRPPVALIAGGRPDQAKALEDVGIATFLHVPSPGLLAQFLDAGARRFVFEGAECGGHVGPRTSFTLWQAQLDVLRDRADIAGVQILFAGGVHDARSAAMVSALAAPLHDRGAAVGVLMGTGYLFTEEAVTHGAVTATFQRQVVAAERTALLHTAPGHATRCVPSPFVDAFEATGRELLDRGVPQREVWEELEKLNTGRLRIASKGLRREGPELVAVDEAGVLDQGLFMAGQVAMLRDAVTTVAELHQDVTARAAEFHRDRATRLRAVLGKARPQRPAPQPLDVAVVGMACLFPGAPDLASFWANIVGNADCVTEVPPRRWDAATYYDPAATRGSGDATPSKWGGFLDPVPFDPLRYGIPPAALAAIEPVQLLALEAAHRSLVDAGYAEGGFDRERAGVVFGAEAGSDLSTAATLRMVLPSYVDQVPAELDAQLPKLTEDSFPGRLANVISGRIANRLDLGAVNYTVDAACASSLAAVDVACKELAAGTADLMLCGGADLHNAIDDYLLFSSVGALSATGACRTFDANADGIALGEGVACVVLKRLADAEHDGDRVYAVIRGVGSASDGKALGLTAPRKEGQRRALDRAYANARVSPAEVDLVEAHGTGTVVGDRTELQTLTEVFTEAGARPGSCVVGSVKSQIGHTKCAAGLAGLIKSAMALHTGVRPPTLHVTEPNPAWDATSPFAFLSAASPWLREATERVAGVSAFGFGGTNFHVVMTGHASAAFTRRGLRRWPAELFTFRGADDAAAHRQIERLLESVTANAASGNPWTLRDLARTAAARADREVAPVRVSVVAEDLDHLQTLLRRALAGESDPKAGLYRVTGEQPRGKLAVLFPGQGSQRPGMLSDLFVAFPDLARFAGRGEIAAAMFPPAAFDQATADAQRDRLRDTRMAQPALGVTGLAVHELLTKVGVEADMYAGHSYGELVALTAAGSLDPRDLVALSAVRARTILAAAGDDAGAMAAVSADRPTVESVLDGARLANRVVIANHNAPRQIVVSGPTSMVEEAVAALRAAGISAKRLDVACAFHSPVIAGASDAFASELASRSFAAPRVPVWGNRLAKPYVGDAEGIRAELASQVTGAVKFCEQIENMYADGARVFLEAGPGRVLTNLVREILGDRPHTVIPIEPTRDAGLPGFLHALARLAVAGVPLRTGWLVAARGAQDVSTLTPPARPGWTVDGHLVRTADGKVIPGGLAPAKRIATLSAAGPAPAPASTRDEMVADFLRTSREMITAQRDVLLGYLGAAPAPTAPALTPAERPALGTPAPAARPADVLSTVVGLIAERTGYPADMVDPGLDLEADLSVDSIKRTEIAGELAARLGSAVDVESLVRARTAAELAALLAPAQGPQPAPVAGQQAQTVDVLSTVVGLIAERTGYPADMIDPSLDLEADLSVDSIKRTEIAGELVSRLGGSANVEDLVRARTAAELAGLLAPGHPAQQAVVVDVLSTVVGLIAERTGYPVDMIDPGLDLEADLSVDSIKRTEIAGELVSRLGGSANVEDLVRARTAAELAGLLAPAQESQSAPAVDVLSTVVGLIAERTGYPADMIDPSLDLEADLSVDSIKRTEIAGELVSRLGSGVDVEALVRARTAAELADLLAPRSAAPAAPAAPKGDALSTVVAVIAERTGYPADMIDPSLDLEADLSVDSIKRTEIAGDLAARLGSTADLDELVRARTAAALADLLTATPKAAAPAPTAAAPKTATGPVVRGEAPGRYVLGLVDAPGTPSDDPGALFGATLLIAGGTPDLVEELAGQLSARGALAMPLPGLPELAEWVDRVDGLICLPSGDEPLLPAAFPMFRSVLERRPRWLLAAAHGDPLRTAGLRGFFRTLRREYPDTMSRLVEFEGFPADDYSAAAAVIEELLTPGAEPVVVRSATRQAFDLVPTPLGALAMTGSGPAGPGVAEAEAMGLSADSVVLLVGGARGITAQVARALAAATGCKIELAGRTGPATEPEHPATAAAHDLAGLRKALAGLGHTGPAAIDRAARDILARREVNATLAGLRRLGSEANLHALDVRDPDAVRRLVKQIHAEHGRIDAVVHAAGVIEDKLIAEKDPESFRRVFATKVDGLAALLAGLDDVSAAPRFVVSFGSIAAALGNRGQADYAAANDALDVLGAAWSKRTGHRALTVHWGPWAPDEQHGGMVSVELGRSYAERGVKLISPADGVAALLSELAWGSPEVRSVVYTASGW